MEEKEIKVTFGSGWADKLKISGDLLSGAAMGGFWIMLGLFSIADAISKLAAK
jgi:hypothetical protein